MTFFQKSVFKDINVGRNFRFRDRSKFVVLFTSKDLSILKSFKNKLLHTQREKRLFFLFYSLRFKKFKFGSMGIVFNSLNNLRPLTTFCIKRVSGVRHRIPIFSFVNRRDEFQAITWLYNASKFQPKKTLNGRLVREVVVSSQKKGLSTTYKTAYNRLVDVSRPLLKYL